MGRTLGILAALALLAAPALGQEEEIPKSAASAQFLTIGVGARAAALGQAYTALADDATALYWNPAALTNVEKRSATVMHATTLGSGNLEYGAAAMKVGQRGAAGLSFQYFSYGTIEGVDEQSAETGQSFKPNDMALSMGYAYALKGGSLEGLAVGAAGKFIQSTLVDSASTFAVDLGVLSPAVWGGRARFAAAMTNLGKGLRFGEETEPLPSQLRFGGSLKPWRHVAFAAEGVRPTGEGVYGAFGTEVVFPQEGGWSLAARAGYNTRAASWSPLAGFATGLGFAYKFLGVDVAIMPETPEGPQERVSLNFTF